MAKQKEKEVIAQNHVSQKKKRERKKKRKKIAMSKERKNEITN